MPTCYFQITINGQFTTSKDEDGEWDAYFNDPDEWVDRAVRGEWSSEMNSLTVTDKEEQDV